MKHKIFKSLTLLCAMLLGTSVGLAVEQYCHKEMTSGGHTIYVTGQKTGEGTYQLLIESSETMTGLGGSFINVNGVGGYQLNAAGHYAVSADGKTITCDIESNVAPTHYTPLYVLMPGEVNFGQPDIDYSQVCAPQILESEYCNYEGNETKDGNVYVALSWETDADGNVVITMANGTGATSCAFRNGGFEGGIDAFVVSTDNFATTTPASDYFTFTKVYSGNTAMLVKIADLPANAKIKHVGQGHAFAWTVNGKGAYCFPDFIYTYGSVCPSDYPVTGVTLNTASRTIEVGTTYTLTATVAPDYATNKNVTWSSSAEGVAIVANGVVTPVAPGTATITVTTEDGGFTATCEVTVIDKTSQCYGDLGHFATPTNTRMHYEIVYEDSKATFTITGLYAPLDYGEVQIVEKGNFGMTADGNGGYTYTFNNMNVGDKLYFRFLYSDTSMPGNEMTSEGLSTSDPNIRYYIMGDCPPPYKKTAEDYTKLAGVTAMSETTRDVSNPAFGIDNDENTFWESKWDMQPQEYTIDLGKECIFNTVIVKFGDHRAGEYDILVSRDGENFKTIATDQAGVNNADASTGVGLTQARFVRLKLKSRPNGYGFDIKNVKVLFVEDSELTTLAISNADNFFQVGQNYTITVDARDQYGVTMDPGTVTYTVSPSSMGMVVNNVFIPAARGVVEITANVGDIVSNTISKHIVSGENLALNNAMQEGGDWVGTYYNTDTPDKAVNGDAGDVWQGSVTNGDDPNTGHNYDAWFVVDLQGAYDIDLITIKFEGACSDAYHIDFSADATNWTTVYSFAKTMGTNAHTDYITSFSESTARYIRFWSTKAATGWGMKVHELQVFGSEATSTTKSVGVSVNDAAMGSATVKQGGVDVTEAEVGTTVVFNAVAKEGYEFINWTKGGVEVSTETTYEVTIEGNTSLQANFDKIYTQYCHTSITTIQGKKIYLTLSKEGDTYQILYEGSSECQLLGLNNANFTINGVCTDIQYIDPVSGNPVPSCGQDVPFNKENGRVSFSTEGFGSAKIVFTLAEGKTWKDIYVWNKAIYFNTASGEVGYTDFPNRYDIAWNKSCGDNEAPVMDAPQAEALNATTIRLTLKATDNWDGDITYIISRTGADDITTTSPSGVATTVDITGLTTGTEYTFSVVAEDEFGNACDAQECKATPAGDAVAPSNVSISAVAVTDKIVRLTMYADDNVPGQLLYNIAWANGGNAQTSAERGTEVVYELTTLTPATEYTFTLTVKDAADNWSVPVNSNTITTFSGNLALNKPATAGYAALPVNEGNDGNKASRWGSGNNDSHPAKDWWSVDLGAMYDLSNIRIMWETARPKFYDILVSNDGTNWTVAQSYNQLPSSSADASAIEDYPITATGRYVKVAATSKEGGYDNLNWGISFWELEAYGTLAVDTEKPVITTFTATGVSSSSVQLKAQATDNFCGQLTYTFYCDNVEKGSVSQAYGEDATFTVTGLTKGTTYNFTVQVADAAGNKSDMSAPVQAQPVTDTEAPQNVSVTAGEITFASIQLLLSATDNLGGDITYTISRSGAADVVATGASGVEKAVVIDGLDYDTEYTFSVVAKDGSNNAAAAVQCTATTEKAKFPVTTAPVPTRPADDVIAVYSDVYTPTFNWGHNEGWGQTTQLQDMQIDGDNFLYYTNFNYLGWGCASQVDASAMNGLHIDVWADADGSFSIVPIYGGPNLATDDTHRKTVNVVGKQWNSFDLDLATDFPGLNLTSIFQFKFDQAVGTIFAIDNLYFFIDPDHVRDNQTIDGLGTVCLPFEVAPANRKGAAFYRISHNDGSFIHFIEETGTLEAGRAYIFQAEAEQVRFYKANDAAQVDAVVIDDESRGLIGTFVDIAPGNLTGKYVIANDYKIHICGSGAYLNANRAYMDLQAIPSTPLEINDPEGAPVRRTLSFGGAPRDVVTNLETLDATAMPNGTYIINNQLVIFRDGKRYNAQGTILR